MTNSLIGDYCEKLQKVYGYILNANSLPRDGELCILLLSQMKSMCQAKGFADHVFKSSRTSEFIEAVWRNLESGDEAVLTFSLQIFDIFLTYSDHSHHLAQRECLLNGFLEILRENNKESRKNWPAAVTAAICDVLFGLCRHNVGQQWIVAQVDVIMDVICTVLSTSQNTMDIAAASSLILQLLKLEGNTPSPQTVNNSAEEMSLSTAQKPNKQNDQSSLMQSLAMECSLDNTSDLLSQPISCLTKHGAKHIAGEHGDDSHGPPTTVVCDNGCHSDNTCAAIMGENGTSSPCSVDSSLSSHTQQHVWNSFWTLIDVPQEAKPELDNSTTGRLRVRPQLLHVLCTMCTETLVRKHILADRKKCQLLLDWMLDTEVIADLIAEIWANILVEDSKELLSEVEAVVHQALHVGYVQRAMIIASKLYSKSSSGVFKDILLLPMRWIFSRDKLSTSRSSVSVSDTVHTTLNNKKALATAVATCLNAALTISGAPLIKCLFAGQEKTTFEKAFLVINPPLSERDAEFLSYVLRLLDTRMTAFLEADRSTMQSLSGNVKLQMYAIQVVKAASADIQEDDRVMDVLLYLLQNPESPAQILPHIFSAIGNMVYRHFHTSITMSDGPHPESNNVVHDRVLCDESSDDIDMDGISASISCASQLSSLAECVLQRLAAVQWEIRDTALEFIQSLIQKYASLDSFWSWLEHHHMLRHAWQCHDDAESYVRATALQTAIELVSVGRWSTFIQHIMADQLSIIREVLDLIKCNAEAFTRRAAIDFIIALYKRNNLTDTIIRSEVFNIFSDFVPNDFDWEVKIKGLHFWESVIVDYNHDKAEMMSPQESDERSMSGLKRSGGDIDDNLNSVNTKTINTLVTIGCVKALRSAYTDYDDSVKKQACVLLKTLQQDIRLGPTISLSSPKQLKIAKEECATNSSPEIVSSSEMHHGKDIPTECSEFIQFLLETDFEGEVNGSLISRDDDKIAEAEHVLDDILRSMNNDEVVLDCY